MPSTFFSKRQTAELDGIVALNDTYWDDPNSRKINLVQGIFQNEEGITPVLNCIRTAAVALVDSERHKPPLAAVGDPEYRHAAEVLVFGAGSRLLEEGRIESMQTPGSTPALRIAAELIAIHNENATVWISSPAYSNHPPIMESARLKTARYRYIDPLTGGLQFEAMLSDLEAAAPGDVVLLHACSHNPGAMDPSPDQWKTLAEFLRDRSLLPLIDNAYLGLRVDIEKDPLGLRTVASICPESLITTSFSKNFAMYAERVGMLSIVTESAARTRDVLDAAKVYVRRTYTSPAGFGARVVGRVLNDPALRAEWLVELAGMRELLHQRRAMFADALDAFQIDPGFFPGIRTARGMFTLSRLTPSHVERLRSEQHIYVLDTGRVSFAGMRKTVVDPFCEGLAAVTSGEKPRMADKVGLP
jgi:aromatic-amino-acid transaminase